MDCKDCGNAGFSVHDGSWKCQLNRNKKTECMRECGKHFVPRAEIEVTIDSDFVAVNVATIIFNQGKAKIFNVLESQIENERRLSAAKRIAQDIISGIAKDASNFILETLDGWQETALTGELLEGEIVGKFKKDHEEVQKAIK